METYRVVSITDRKGNPRIEGRYPLRVGRMCKKPTPRNGDAMMIEWLAQPDGTPYTLFFLMVLNPFFTGCR